MKYSVSAKQLPGTPLCCSYDNATRCPAAFSIFTATASSRTLNVKICGAVRGRLISRLKHERATRKIPPERLAISKVAVDTPPAIGKSSIVKRISNRSRPVRSSDQRSLPKGDVGVGTAIRLGISRPKNDGLSSS